MSLYSFHGSWSLFRGPGPRVDSRTMDEETRPRDTAPALFAASVCAGQVGRLKVLIDDRAQGCVQRNGKWNCLETVSFESSLIAEIDAALC